MSELYNIALGATGGTRVAIGSSKGEGDVLRALPRKTRRVLSGLGLLRRRRGHGDPPDVFATTLRERGPAHWYNLGDGDVIAAWVKLLLKGLAEDRAERRARRRRRLHLAAGKPTEYAYRNARAIAAGYASLWHYRKAKGWPRNRLTPT